MKQVLGLLLVLAVVPGLPIAYYIWDLRKRNRAWQEALAELPPEDRAAVEKAAVARSKRNGMATAVFGLLLALFGSATLAGGGRVFYGAILFGAVMFIGGIAKYLTGKNV